MFSCIKPLFLDTLLISPLELPYLTFFGVFMNVSKNYTKLLSSQLRSVTESFIKGRQEVGLRTVNHISLVIS